MIKKIILLATTLLMNMSYGSERAKSPKPYIMLSAYLPTVDKPISIGELIEQTKALASTTHTDTIEEIKRNEQLATNYEQLCANLKSRGLKEKFDKFKTHALQCRKEVARLKSVVQVENELNQLDDTLCSIFNDEKLGDKSHRWVAARSSYVRMAKLAQLTNDHETYKKTMATIEFIDTRKQPISNQLNLIKELEADGNLSGMITAYESLLLLAPERQVDIHPRITELRAQVAKETALFDVTHFIDTVMKEETSTTTRYDKIVDFCQRTSTSNNNPAVQELCKEQRLKYKKLLAYKEAIAVPEIHDNEFVYTAYRSAINYADSVGVNDIRRSIKLVVEFSHDLPQLDGFCAAIIDHDYEQEVNNAPSTDLKEAGILSKRNIGLEIINLEDVLHKMIQKEDDKVNQALAKVNQTSNQVNLVELANAYHARAEFYQKHYPATQKAKIDRNRYDARNTGLQAFNKNKQIRELLNFAL